MIITICHYCAEPHKTASCPLYRFSFNYPPDYQCWFDKIEDLKIRLYSIRRNISSA